MKLILARHGETDLNRQGRIQGVNDDSLNATGRSQAHALAQALKGEGALKLYVSPIHRAMQTAQVIAAAQGVDVEPLEGLAEADAGDLEGLTGPEMRSRYPEFAEHWSRDVATAVMPGGESLRQVQERAWNAVTSLRQRHPDDTIIAVSHNFTIRTIICSALELPLVNSRRLQLDLASISRLALSDSGHMLTSLNETWHLADIGDED